MLRVVIKLIALTIPLVQTILVQFTMLFPPMGVSVTLPPQRAPIITAELLVLPGKIETKGLPK